MTTNVKDVINNEKYRPYLDNGFVGLVDVMGDDNRIDMAARVSYGGNNQVRSKEEVTRLIRYLMANKHTSPFEMVELLFHIKMPIFVMRQHIRHRTACLTGDTKISFNDEKTITIKELFNNNSKSYKINHINENEFYTANKIGRWFLKKLDEYKDYVMDSYYLEGNNGQHYFHYYGKDVIEFANWLKKNDVKVKQRKYPVVSLNEDNKTIYIKNKIAQVYESGEKYVFEVVTNNGQRIKASSDHLFFTEDGWVKLKDLKIGSKLWCADHIYNKEFIPPTINIEAEEWKPIKSNCFYEVSSQGRVRNESTKALLPKSYHLECNWVKILDKSERVCTLVMEAFKEKPNPSFVIKRLNNNLLDDRLENLEWVSPFEDLIDSSYSSFLSEIIDIIPIGYEQTYDISIDGKYHNFVANNFIVHNSVNEYSGRYSEMDNDFYIPELSRAFGQSSNNKQQSINNTSIAKIEKFIDHLNYSYTISFSNYCKSIKDGISKEIARIQLPLANYTELYWKINLHNFFHYIKLRDDEDHAQIEIVQLARIMYNLVKEKLPISCQAFEDYQKNSISFSNNEIELLKDIFESRSLETIDDNNSLSMREKKAFKHKLNKILG